MQVALGEKQCFPSKAGAGQTSVTLQNYPVFQPGERISIKYKFRDYTEPQQASFRRSTKENYCMKFLNTSGMPGMCHRLFNKPIWRD